MSRQNNLHASISNLVEKIKKNQTETGENPPWVKQVAMLTGILAAFSGFLAVRSTSLTNDAIYESNQAILAQTQSSDAWSEYQADSIKARIIETQLIVSPNLNKANRALLETEAAQLRSRQPQSKQLATDKATERDEHLKGGFARLAEKDLLEYAGLAAQIGIAVASVAALVRLRTAFYVGIAAGLAGVAITAYAFANHYGIAP